MHATSQLQVGFAQRLSSPYSACPHNPVSRDCWAVALGYRVALFRRIEKLRRLLRWRIAPSTALPVWWHVGRPNFGDDINPSFFQRLHGGPVRFATDRRQPHILGAGSILEHSLPTSVVCGSGLLQPPRGPVAAAEFVAVRGGLSAAACGASSGVLLGDPLVLINTFVARSRPARRYGFVPHVTSVTRWRRLACDRRCIIDPAGDPWRTIAEIAACEVVFSQSLHGLIVADAFGIPNVWVVPSDTMVGGCFKFEDYFSTLESGKLAVPEGPDLFLAPERYETHVGQYRFCKHSYRESLADACSRSGVTRYRKL